MDHLTIPLFTPCEPGSTRLKTLPYLTPRSWSIINCLHLITEECVFGFPYFTILLHESPPHSLLYGIL